MTIAELRERSNQAVSGIPKDVLLVGIVLLFSTASFGLGMLAERDRAAGKSDGFWIENGATTTAQAAAIAAPLPVAASGTPVTPAAGKYVASKNGTKYYLPDCSGASRIKESNKVWFASLEDAQKAGYSAASNCPGL